MNPLGRISLELANSYVGTGNDPWEGSPFAWILSRTSRQKGKIGEELVASWLTEAGFSVERSPDSEADRLINGKRVEIKLSTLWGNGTYVFQQLRDQNYDVIICIGLSPDAAHAWVMKKSEIPFSELRHQHAGVNGSDTWWLPVNPAKIPEWLMPYGGTLEAARERLAQIL